MRRRLLTVLAILLLTSTLLAAEDDARAIIDRLVRTPRWAQGEAGLTEMGCALLRQPETEVLTALSDAMDRRLVTDSVAATYSSEIESLARLVLGAGPPKYFHMRYRSIAGLLVRDRLRTGEGSGPLPPRSVCTLADLVGETPRVRLRLGINAKRVLAFILEPEGAPTWSEEAPLARELGRALGRAAAEDPAFSRRLVEMLKGREFAKKSGPEKWTTGALMSAVAHGPAKSADGILLAMVRRGWNDYDSLALLRSAGRLGVLDSVRDDVERSGSRVELTDFRFHVGGDYIVRPLLDAARKSGAPAAAQRVADVGSGLWPYRGELIRQVLPFALELGGSEDEDRRKAARRVLNSFVWAGRCGTSGRARGIGGYPDPIELARRVREDLKAGRIELLPGWIYGPGVYSGHRDLRYFMWPRGGGRNPVFLTAKREGDEVIVTITNHLEEPVCLNRTAFRYSAAEETRARVKRDGKKVDLFGVKLGIGAVLTQVSSRCRKEDYAILAPGASLTFRYPLQKGFPAENVVAVSFRDWFEAPENLPAPRITWLREVRAR